MLKALGEPRRLEILRLLRKGPRAVGEIAAEVDVSQQAVSQHLAVLDRAGLVEARKEGTRSLYAIRPAGFLPVQEFVQGFWEPRLAALKGEIEKEEMSEVYRTQIDIEAEPERVFDYFVRPELLVRWMGDFAKLEAKDGGLFAVDINGVIIRGTFARVERPHLIEIAWGEAGNDAMPPGSTRLVIRLTALENGTRVELAHNGLVQAEAEKHAMGWPHFLGRLSIAAAGRDPGLDPWATATSKV